MRDKKIHYDGVVKSEDLVTGYMGCKDYTDYMASILSMAISITCISYDTLHCNADKSRAIEGVEYRVRDLFNLLQELKKLKIDK